MPWIPRAGYAVCQSVLESMTRFLRTASPRRLALAILATIALVAGGAAIAVGATSGGPVARTEPLATALHSALLARPVQGISANVTFTSHLIDSADLQGSDPLLNGASGRLWMAGQRLRIELQSNGGNGDAELVVDGRSFWAFDPASNTVYRGTLPPHHGTLPARRGMEPTGGDHVPTITEITRELAQLSRRLDLSQAIGTDVGHQAAYQVKVSPKLAGGMLDSVQLAWDALRGVPLSIGIYARGNPDPVLALSASDISYGPQSAGSFSAAPPAGAKIDDLGVLGSSGGERAPAGPVKPESRSVEGVAPVAARVPFSLDAPASLAGRTRSSVRLVHLDGHPAALVTYGRDLDGIAVLESITGRSSAAAPAPAAGDHAGLSLPTVSLGDVTATELDTALGSLVHFQRAGVGFTVLGSVPRTVIDQAAREL